MTWPTLPAFSANNFLDHFTGSSLNARWAAVTSGTGVVSVTDGYVEFNAPIGNPAFMYLTSQLDKTKSQLWLAAVDVETDDLSSFATPMFLIVNGATAPKADTHANYDTIGILKRDYANQSSIAALDQYWNGSGTHTLWDGQNASPAWTPTYTTALASMIPIRSSDYYISGLEIDGPNARFRLLGWCQTYPTAGTWLFNQGWRLFAQTDWVPWLSVRSTANLWLIFGFPYSDATNAHDVRVEWVRYAESVNNSVVDAFAADKQNLASAHRIRHYWSYDGLTNVAQDRTTWAIDLGGVGTFDVNEVQEPWCVYDGATTDYLFYTGTNATSVQSIGVASATHASPQDGPWTKFVSNPLIQVGPTGSFDDNQVGFPCVVKDNGDTDANKRWKMLYAGKKAADGKWRTGYATAANATGPWTKQGMVIDVGGTGTDDVNAARDCVLLVYNNQWEIWYEGWDSNNAGHLMRATATNLANITKDPASPYYSPGSVDQAITANISTAPGRTVSVASTTGFNADEIVAFSQSNNMDTYSASRIRKIVNPTTLELYHGLTGFTTVVPARLRQASSWPNLTPRWIGQVNGQWWFYINIWEPFTNGGDGASYNALLEEGHLFQHSAAAPNGATPALNALASPVTSRGFNNDQESLENMTLVNTPFAGFKVGGGGGLLLRSIG